MVRKKEKAVKPRGSTRSGFWAVGEWRAMKTSRSSSQIQNDLYKMYRQMSNCLVSEICKLCRKALRKARKEGHTKKLMGGSCCITRQCGLREILKIILVILNGCDFFSLKKNTHLFLSAGCCLLAVSTTHCLQEGVLRAPPLPRCLTSNV